MNKVFRNNPGTDIGHQPAKREKQAPAVPVKYTHVKKRARWQSFYTSWANISQDNIPRLGEATGILQRDFRLRELLR